MISDSEKKRPLCHIPEFSLFCKKNQGWLLPLVLFLLAFLIRYIYWRLDPFLSRDACFYIEFTNSLHENGNYMKIENQPLIPVFLFEIVDLLMYCGISARTAGLAVNMIMGSLVPVFTYAYTQEIFHQRKLSVFSAFLLCFHPSMIKLSVQFQRDMVYLSLCGLLFLLLCLYMTRKKNYYCAAAGCIFAFSCLTRYETIELLLIFMAVDFVFVIKHVISLKYGIKSFCVFLFSAFIAGLLFTICTGTFFFMKDNYMQYMKEKIELIQKIRELKNNV